MEDGTLDLTNTAILAVVAPTPDQLAEAHISAQMLEDDRALLSIQEPTRLAAHFQETHMRTRVQMTREDEAIFDRMDSMSPQFIYEDADEADYERMLWIMRARARFDLASPAVRIEG